METLSAPPATPVVRPPAVAFRLASDARLVRLAASGSEGAIAAIFERHHQALHRYCHSILGNTHDAADALQNTMIKALRALPGEKREIVLRPWLYKIAHNESISLLRARRPESDLDTAVHLSDPAAASVVDSRERLRSLTTDLGELTERQRGALLMRELGGLEFAEVAEALDSTASAAKQSVYEARCALQDMQAGRDMDCETVRRALSDGDRRTLRGMRMRGHLRACAGCRDFETAMRQRPVQLAAIIPPLPLAAATAILHGILGGSGTHGGGGLAAGLAGTAKTATGFSLAAKAATVAAVGATLAGGAVYAAPELQPARPTHPPARSIAAASTSPATRSAAARALRHLGSGSGARHATRPGASKHKTIRAGTLDATLSGRLTGAPSSAIAGTTGPAAGTPGSNIAATAGPPAGTPRSNIAATAGPPAGTPRSNIAATAGPPAGTPRSNIAATAGPPAGTPRSNVAAVNSAPVSPPASSTTGAYGVPAGTPGSGALGSTRAPLSIPSGTAAAPPARR